MPRSGQGPVRLELSPPTVVAQAQPEIRGWGPYQFPAMRRCRDGGLHVTYHLAADSAKAYGSEAGHAVSWDGGASWEPGEAEPGQGHTVLPDGTEIVAVRKPSLPVSELGKLPAPVGSARNYGQQLSWYPAGELDRRYPGYWMCRREPRETEWREYRAEVRDPEAVRYTVEGVLPRPSFWNTRIDPAGKLWACVYGMRMDGGELSRYSAVHFFLSTDAGFCWDLVGSIPYRGDGRADPYCDDRFGFTEPDLAFTPSGGMVALLRTTDGCGPGPLYCSRSADGGGSWSTPAVWDEVGVWPRMVRLGNGSTVAVYGRPGLYVRASADPELEEWDPRIAVVPPGELHTETCSYGDLLAVDEDQALLVYSDFGYPNAEGEPCKTILCRRLTAGASSS